MITDAHLNPKVVKLINFQNSVILSKFDKKFSKVNQVIYSLAPISILNMKALAQILFEISCTQDFQDFFSKGDNSERGHNSEKKKNTGHFFFFFMRNPYMKFQDTSIHRLKVKKKWCGHTDKPKAICPTNFFKVGGIMRLLHVTVTVHIAKSSMGAMAWLSYIENCIIHGHQSSSFIAKCNDNKFIYSTSHYAAVEATSCSLVLLSITPFKNRRMT